ncbi:hypothetical protein EV174_004764 [Coemansia sp. RSA 2320]|nr:hypothetical protein EV174_004764 [Coemansia sp. RSA 2320]
MSDTDDFNYDSVVSDPGAYTGFLENADQSGVTRRRGNSEASNLLTPAGKARATTPPPPATPSAYGYGVNDSMPSLAVSTPNSEKFQIEFEHERQSNVQFGLKSGMYNHGQGAAGATDDFSAQLEGRSGYIIVSGAGANANIIC